MTAPQSKQGPLFTHPLAFAILLFPFFPHGVNLQHCSLLSHCHPPITHIFHTLTGSHTNRNCTCCFSLWCYCMLLPQAQISGGMQGIEMFKKHYKGEKVQQHYSEIMPPIQFSLYSSVMGLSLLHPQPLGDFFQSQVAYWKPACFQTITTRLGLNAITLGRLANNCHLICKDSLPTYSSMNLSQSVPMSTTCLHCISLQWQT